jgi:putative aminopeptidase FrvX
MDGSSIAPRAAVEAIEALAKAHAIPAHVAINSGGTDGASFTAVAGNQPGLSWPGRYSHSGVEVVDARDLNALAALVRTIIER